MKNKLFALALLLLVLFAAGFKYQASEPRFEYKIETTLGGDKLEANYLTALGKQGWELVAVERAGRDERTYFLKRAVK
ncbi:MAG: hypothetical protein H0X14_00055 [Acidobacteria bacterium]|nr:hypothetical protein [Acidobacteriota bacterium]